MATKIKSSSYKLNKKVGDNIKHQLFFPKFKITQPLLANLMAIEKARGFLEAANLSSGWIKKMSQHAILLESHHTTHIEGTRLSLEQSKQILAGKKVSTASKDDIKELKNYRDAFNLISNYFTTKHILTESLIKNIHKELVKGVRGGIAQPGMYRKIQNYVGNALGEVIYMCPKPTQVPSLMKDFVSWVNKKSDIHPVLKSGIIQFQFVHIHPFIDGNGRTSRLLCAFYLYKSNYDFKRLFSISEYYDKDRSKFYNAIQSVRDNNMDMTGWLEYFVSGFLFQINHAMDIGKKVILADTLIKNHSLSKRQGMVIEHILENGKMFPKDFEKFYMKNKINPKITKRTLQRDLKDMIDKKIIKVQGATHKIFYILGKRLDL